MNLNPKLTLRQNYLLMRDPQAGATKPRPSWVHSDEARAARAAFIEENLQTNSEDAAEGSNSSPDAAIRCLEE